MKKLSRFVFAVLFLLPVCAFATDKTFTTSGSIADGDVFNLVQIQNDGTVVNMSGGQIGGAMFGGLWAYNNSTFNMSGGQIVYPSGISISSLSTIYISGGTTATGDFVVDGSANILGGSITADRLKTSLNSVVNINNAILNFDLFDIHGGTLNIYRGVLDVDNASIGYQGYAQGTINIYGNDFNYNPSTQILMGDLLDNNPFTIRGVDSLEYARFNLIPEPISVLLFGFGLLALRKQKEI